MKTLFILLSSLLIQSSLFATSSLRKVVNILPAQAETIYANHPYGDRIISFLKNQTKCIGFTATGFDNKEYLVQIERQVRAFYPYQNKETGAIIDPVYKIEWQYSTPCYALSVGLLNKTGFIKDAILLKSGIRALDCSIAEMNENRCAHHHGEFFIQPIMLALDLYKGYVSEAQMTVWKEKIAEVDPYLLYKDNLQKKKFCYNHNVVALAGEYIRMKENIAIDRNFLEIHFEHQKQYMSANGLYIDSKTNPPMVYDEFTRQFMTSILVEGYDGACKDFYSRKLLDGAWTSIFMQSPYGEVPTGGRSAQHIWNEAAAAVTYEIYASQYASQGKMKEAGAFKRAAHLSLKSISRWKREDGSGFIVKNRFPIETMHGYESYSAQSQYNLLACWLMSVAYLYADDSIEELPSPADVGGYIIPMQDVFHKLFANVGGNYIEYELSGDPRYNATGLIRIHLKNSNPQLGPTDAIPHKWDNKKKKDLGGEVLSVGPAWFDKEGVEHRLAEYTNISYPNTELYSAYTGTSLPEIKVTIKEQTLQKVSFEVAYIGNFGGVSRITQQFTINEKGLIVKDNLQGEVQSMRVYYPMLVDDGEEMTRVNMTNNKVSLSLRDGDITFEALSPRKSVMKRSGISLYCRNGYAEAAYFDVPGKEAEYKVTGR
ncbi:hypothetical protein [Bacteroides congonensis]